MKFYIFVASREHFLYIFLRVLKGDIVCDLFIFPALFFISLKKCHEHKISTREWRAKCEWNFSSCVDNKISRIHSLCLFQLSERKLWSKREKQISRVRRIFIITLWACFRRIFSSQLNHILKCFSWCFP